MIRRTHYDYSVLRDNLVSYGYTLTHTSDIDEWWSSPQGGDLCVDLPESDPYVSIKVEFEYYVSTEELRFLGFST